MEENKFKFPTEMVELPSKGLLYPEGHPLSSGQVEMKYMTAREEDILTNQNYIRSGVVIDKLLQSMIVTKFDYKDLLVGDKDAIMLAARILGYGKDYEFTYYPEYSDSEEKLTVDLTQLKEKILQEKHVLVKGKNEFSFKLPATKNEITFKILTHGDEQNIDKEIQGLKKIDPKGNSEVTTRLRHMILSINGDYDKKSIREFIEYGLLAKDSRAFREYFTSISPGIDLKYNYVFDNGGEEDITIPISTNFFWPDSGV
jgi:hypothetical protein